MQETFKNWQELLESYVKHKTKAMFCEILQLRFDTYFNEFCKIDCFNVLRDTTLGATFGKIESLVFEEIYSFVNELYKKCIPEIDLYIDSPKIQDNIKYLIAEAYPDKKNKLFEKGIVDENGDYTGVNIENIEVD